MRRIRDLLGLLLVIQVSLLGCATTESQLKPPKPQEEYNSPPDNDRRYNGPIEYPKEAMDVDPLMKKAKEKKNTPGPMNSPTSMGRMGAGSGF
jgi:hypothetical protein